MLFGIFQLRVGNVLLVYLLCYQLEFSHFQQMSIFSEILVIGSFGFFFYTSLLRYAWNHGSAQVYIQIPICLSVECLCYLFINISFRKTNCLWSFFRRLRKHFLLCTLIVSSMSAYSVSEEFAIVTILSSGMSPPSP